jgi:hypothetical protein
MTEWLLGDVSVRHNECIGGTAATPEKSCVLRDRPGVPTSHTNSLNDARL